MPSKEYTLEAVEVVHLYPVESRQGKNNKTYKSMNIALKWSDISDRGSWERFRVVTCGYEKIINEALSLQAGDIVTITCRLSGIAYTDKNTQERKIWNKDEVQQIIKGTQASTSQDWGTSSQANPEAQAVATEFGGTVKEVTETDDIPF